jgi:hypothetical protein
MAQRREDAEFTGESPSEEAERRTNAEAAGLTTADLAGRADTANRDKSTSVKSAIGEGAVPGGRAQVRAADDSAPAGDSTESRLLPEHDLLASREHWEAIQVGFVDEPRRSVKEADQLVARLMSQLAESFSQERERLEGQWDRGDDVSTEDLRVALQRYRSFFERLLAA